MMAAFHTRVAALAMVLAIAACAPAAALRPVDPDMAQRYADATIHVMSADSVQMTSMSAERVIGNADIITHVAQSYLMFFLPRLHLEQMSPCPPSAMDMEHVLLVIDLTTREGSQHETYMSDGKRLVDVKGQTCHPVSPAFVRSFDPSYGPD